MMKNFFTLFILLFSLNSALACSCSSLHSFCSSYTNHDLTASCVIIESFPNGISMEVLQVFNGIENSNIITVWDLGGPYDNCNDSLSDVTRAAFLGSIGDTIIVSLPKVDTLKNEWDVIGDYRVPGFLCWEYKLEVSNNTVLGKISGSEFCEYMNNCLETYNYDDFLIDFPVNSLNCQTWLSTENLDEDAFLAIYPNPSTDRVIIETSESGNITVTNSCGKLVDAYVIRENQSEISTDHLQSGIYFLTFKTESRVVTRKLIVQH